MPYFPRPLGLLTITEVSDRTGIPIKTLFKRIAHRRLPVPSVQFGKKRYYTEDQVEAVAHAYQACPAKPRPRKG